MWFYIVGDIIAMTYAFFASWFLLIGIIFSYDDPAAPELSWLHILATYGLVLFLPFIIWYWYSIRKIWRENRQNALMMYLQRVVTMILLVVLAYTLLVQLPSAFNPYNV